DQFEFIVSGVFLSRLLVFCVCVCVFLFVDIFPCARIFHSFLSHRSVMEIFHQHGQCLIVLTDLGRTRSGRRSRTTLTPRSRSSACRTPTSPCSCPSVR